MRYETTKKNDYLYHHGILGQKWGVRRFQNPDGSLTLLGKKRYVGGNDGNDSIRVSTDELSKTREKLASKSVSDRDTIIDDYRESYKRANANIAKLDADYANVDKKTTMYKDTGNTVEEARTWMVISKVMIAPVAYQAKSTEKGKKYTTDWLDSKV